MSSLNVGTVTLSNGLTLPSYTSSPDNRPSHGAGKTIYDSTSDTIQVSDGTQWISAGSAGSGLVTATGGEITFAGGYKVHTWYNVGEYNFQVQGAASGATLKFLYVLEVDLEELLAAAVAAAVLPIMEHTQFLLVLIQ